jgi:hypothetical protein
MDETKLAEAIVTALNSANTSRENTAKAAEEDKRRDETIREFLRLSRTLKDSNAVMTAGKSLAKSILTDQRAQYQNVDKELDDLAKKLDQATTEMDRQLIVQQQENTKRNAFWANTSAAMSNFTLGVKNATIQIGSSLVSASGSFVKGLQGGQSSIELTSGLMLAGVEATNQTAQAASAGISGLGQVAATSTNPKIRALGFVAQGAGLALGFLSNATSKLAKFGIEYLSKELERTVDAFNKTSAAGALFADGMSGMRAAAGAAGLRIDQMANVIANNSEKLAASGLGVTGGTKAIGNAMKEGGKEAKQALLNLGYSFEEQAGLYAETAANMRKTAGGKSSDTAVAEQTRKYAENLRIIAAITGEDARKKTEAVAQQNQILAFQQELAKKSPEQRAQIDAAMANMSEIQAKNFRDTVIFGQVINRDGAIYEATISGAKEKTQALKALYDKDTLTAKSSAEVNAQFGEQIKKSAIAQKDLAIASYANVGDLAGPAKGMLDEINIANKFTKDAVTAGLENVAGQATTKDKLTGSLTSAAVTAQEFAVALQEQVLPLISKFATIADKMMAEMEKTFKEIGKEINVEEDKKTGKASPEDTELSSTLKKVAKSVVEIGSKVAGGIAGGAVGSLLGPVSAAIAGGLGVEGGTAIGSKIVDMLGLDPKSPGKAAGGIATGSSRGYLEKLHGPEAVVPLPDGKSIPVTVKMAAEPATSPEYSKEYLEKAADPNRFGRFMVSVEKAQELLGNMQKAATTTPVAASVATPVATPVATTIVAPVATPTVAPVAAPVATPVATPVAPVAAPVKEKIPQPSMITSLFASAVDASAVLKDVLNSGVSKLKDMFDIQKPLSNIKPDNKSTDIASVLAQQFKNLTTGFSDSNKLLQDTTNGNIVKISTGFNSSIEVSEAKFNERYASLATKFADANKGLDPASIASFTNAATRLSLAAESKPAASASDMASMLKGFVNDATSQLSKQDAARLSTLTKTLGDSSTQLTAKTTDLTLAATSEQRIQNMESMVSSFIVDTSGKLTGDWNKFLSDVKESTAVAKPVVEPVKNMLSDNVPSGLTDVLQKSNDSLREILQEQTDLMKDHISRIDRLVDLASTGNNINQQLLNNAY